MALTVTQLGRTNVTGNRLTVALKVVPDTSWLAAGEALNLTQYVSSLETVLIDSDPGGYVWSFDRSAAKLLAYEAGADGTPLDAVATTTDLSGQTLYITVSGGRA
tara:strand:- start:9938 stop:10252 length:315 start_codon:yes stop_codon:yes gene_type:complete